MAMRVQAFERSDLGRRILAGRPFPLRPNNRAEIPDLSWHGSAACRDADEETSYVLTEAEQQSDVGVGDIEGLCGRCPVAFDCLRSGVVSWSYGVWGGLVLDRGRPAAVHRRDAA